MAQLNSQDTSLVQDEKGAPEMSNYPPEKPWSVLVYVAHDNDLSREGVSDVEEIAEATNPETMHVGIEIDTESGLGSLRYEVAEPDWEGRTYRKVVERLPEQNSGDPETLRNFLDWGTRRSRAKKRMVVISGHGMGREVAPDDLSYGGSLDMPEIESAFEEAGIGKGNKISVLGFDACVMSMVENAYQFRDQVEYVVASQELVPSDGFPYREIVRGLDGGVSPKNLAKTIVDKYVDHYQQLNYPNVTMASIDAQNLLPILSALDEFGNALAQGMDDARRAAIRRARLYARAYYLIDYVDLLHAAELIKKEIDEKNVQGAADCLIGELKRNDSNGDPIVYKSKNDVAPQTHGLSIWFPAQRQLYLACRKKYFGLRCTKEYPGWSTFLDCYHGVVPLTVTVKGVPPDAHPSAGDIDNGGDWTLPPEGLIVPPSDQLTPGSPLAVAVDFKKSP